jgi:putative flippase GtrA
MIKLFTSFIDSFYFIFKRFIPLKTYRYAICGGGNMLFDLVLYFIFFHFVLRKQEIDLFFIVLSPHIASLFFVFPITFITGFLLNKFITFQDSNLSGKTQFIRYLLVAIGAIVLSYICMKILVDFMGFYPTLSRLLTMVISVIYSYLLQSRFSFGKIK